MTSIKVADSEVPEQQRTPGSALIRRTFATAAAPATAVPVAGAATPAAHAPAGRRPAQPPAEPDFGPSVQVFDPSTPVAQIQAALDAAAAEQVPAGFGTGRYAFLFKPGTYDVDVRLGSCTSVAGLGLSPGDVTINGAVRVEGQDQPGGGDSALTRFWRSAENLAVDGSVASWSDAVRNQVRAGVEGSPARSFPDPPTALPTSPLSPLSPLSREKPYLYVDGGGAYRVFLPGLRHDGAGAARADGPAPGSSVPVERFFVAKPTDSVRTINKALSQGKHLLLTPGTYELTDTIRVKWAGTVVLGLGRATLNPQRGVVAMAVATARGVRIAGLLFDAGPVNSRALLEIGARRGGRTDPRDPTSVQDVFFRVGGAGAGKATTALVVNADDVLLDRVWAWRADHGTGVGRTVDTAETGVVVNGDNVLATGLFVEHFQKDDVVWNGDGGRTIMFRNELPYDPPDQAA